MERTHAGTNRIYEEQLNLWKEYIIRVSNECRFVMQRPSDGCSEGSLSQLVLQQYHVFFMLMNIDGLNWMISDTRKQYDT